MLTQPVGAIVQNGITDFSQSIDSFIGRAQQDHHKVDSTFCLVAVALVVAALLAFASSWSFFRQRKCTYCLTIDCAVSLQENDLERMSRGSQSD